MMPIRTICQSTGKPFIIRDEDILFYDKISPIFDGKKYSIPIPSLCPKERERRRLAFRNERVLYRRKSDLSGKSIISFFHPDSPFQVYSQDEWWSDGWDSMVFGRNFDFERTFFEQFYELQLAVPRPPLVNNKSINADYCNFADGNKNCYMLTSANWNEDCYHSFLMVDNKNAADCLWCTDSELLYECTDCRHCYNLRHSQNCENCSDSAYLLDCRSLTDCLLCVGLREKKYHILNKSVSKEKFKKTMEEMKEGYPKYQEMIKRFEDLKQQFPIRRSGNFISSENVTGDNIFNSQNIHEGFDIYESRDCAYLHDGLKGKDCYDICFFDETELCYESTSLIGYGYRFTNFCRDSYNLFYCDNCHNCKNCFGCVGLRNKEYCIFNKQYSKENYEKQVAQIISHMQNSPYPSTSFHSGAEPYSWPKAGSSQGSEWGEFFPIQYSLFAYNETLAQDYFLITREEAIRQGWLWRDETHEKQTIDRVIDDVDRLPDRIENVPDDVLNWAIRCKESNRPYKIQSAELSFYRKMGIPLPHHHPDVRLKKRLKRRNPRILFDRKCQKCKKTIQTTYAPEKMERVYCEKCYLNVVY